MKDHLKRLAAPKSWPIMKKGLKWVVRPFPGSHSLEHGVSIDTFLKDMIRIAKSSREVRAILNHKTVLVNGRRVKDVKFLVGLFDVIELKEAGIIHRILINEQGLLETHTIAGAEATLKPSRIRGKTMLGKDRVQLNLGDGRNLIEKQTSHAIGDTLFIDVASGKIAKAVSLAKGAFIILISGKHIGKTGKIADVKGNKILVETKDKTVFETRRAYAFALGKEKPEIAMLERQGP